MRAAKKDLFFHFSLNSLQNYTAMSVVYDNWERLVGAVLKREELRRIALCESLSSSISADFSSYLSFDSAFGDVLAADSSRHGVQPIKFKEIKKATKNFRHNMLLGEGAFGDVFKGWIDKHTLTASKRGSGMAVAVRRRIQHSLHGHKEWLKEINYLSQLRHPNLVRLIGYCSEENNLILVHEFMPKGSLDNHLFREHQSLSWATRIRVAVGAARGLSFLHDLATPVIHRGCQCSNILLDGEFNPRLSDFGLARDGPTGDMTHVSTRVVGTYGIGPPEYITTGRLTTKCDVFCFGVVLLELLSGLRALDTIRPKGKRYLVDWAIRYLGDERKLSRIMDARLEGRYPHNEAHIVAKLALQCLSSDPNLRPRMAEVVVALEQL